MTDTAGVLLVNLGTPTAPEAPAVRRFLDEFLSDPLVVDLPRWLWLPLLRGVILPLRSRRVSGAYRSIWMPEGSPLMVYSSRLAQRLADALADKAASPPVVLAMRYGDPGIEAGLARLRAQGVGRVLVLPLYPQYSITTTETVIQGVEDALQRLHWAPQLQTIRDYHDDPGWIDALASSVQRHQAEHGQPDHLLLSFHGIPQRYVDRKGDVYQAQCESSAHELARALGLEEGRWSFSYQSRVGREPWLMPYTDQRVRELAESGVKKLAVLCPGFAVDCLETLEEIAMQNQEFFVEAGGETLEYIAALNDHPDHARALAGLVTRALASNPEGASAT